MGLLYTWKVYIPVRRIRSRHWHLDWFRMVSRQQHWSEICSNKIIMGVESNHALSVGSWISSDIQRKKIQWHTHWAGICSNLGGEIRRSLTGKNRELCLGAHRLRFAIVCTTKHTHTHTLTHTLWRWIKTFSISCHIIKAQSEDMFLTTTII